MLSLPALEFLRSDYTEVWVPTAVVPLVCFADRVRPLLATGLDRLALPVDKPPELVETLRGFDSIVSWYGANNEDFRAEVARLRLPATFLPALPGPANREHCADYFALQVGAPVPAFPRIPVAQAEPENVAVIHPFSGGRRKNWPLDRFRELACRLPLPVLWTAGPEETLEGAQRFENLLELAGWIAGARVYIGNDSGITHLAAAAGARTVAIFGPTDPAIWAPRGGQVRLVYDELANITVERILDAVTSLL